MKNLIILTLFSAFLLAQSQPISLEESINKGLSNNPEIKIARAELEKRSEKKWEITSQMLPKLSLNAGYMRMSEVPEFSLSLPVLPQPVTIVESIPNRYSLDLRIEQPVFTGFKLSSLRSSAQYQKSAAEISLEKTINDEKLNITRAFWNFYKTNKIVKLIEEKLTGIEEHLKNTRSFVQNGLATRNDLLKLEVQYSNIKLMLTEAENGNRITRSFFNKAIGAGLFEETDIFADTTNIQIGFDVNDSGFGESAAERPEIKIIDKNIGAANEFVSAARSDYFPSVFAYGDFYYNRPNQQIFPLKDKFDDTWDVGIGLKWTLWDWGGTSARTSQAEYQSQQLIEKRNDLLDKLKIDIYSKYLSVKKEEEKIQLSKLSVQSAKENLRITEKKYDMHVATSTDLIDAENILLEAETNLTNAVADYKVALAEYYNATGKDLTGE